MTKTIDVYLYDISDAIKHIEDYIIGIDKQVFFNEEKLQDAVIRRLQIIGEAARHIPESVQEKYPEIPWRQISGLRNIVIHEYSGIDIELIWQVSKNDLSSLKEAVKKILKDINE